MAKVKSTSSDWVGHFNPSLFCSGLGVGAEGVSM
jgi:hypothetical protein